MNIYARICKKKKACKQAFFFFDGSVGSDQTAVFQQQLHIGAFELLQRDLDHFLLGEVDVRLKERLLVKQARSSSRTSYWLPQTSGTPRSTFRSV